MLLSGVSLRQEAIEHFQKHGTLRTGEALTLGIHPETLYRLRNEGVLECLTRGVYRLADAAALAHPELVGVAKRSPEGVICLISALSLHELTTQIPHQVHLAVQRGSTRPTYADLPLQVYTFHERAFLEGISTMTLEESTLRVYNPEKTLADTFRYRQLLGLDVFLEALKLYRQRRGASPQRILDYARLWRASKTIMPYLEGVFA